MRNINFVSFHRDLLSSSRAKAHMSWYMFPKDEESLVKQAFLMSFDLHCNGKNSFHSHLMNMSEYFQLPDFIN